MKWRARTIHDLIIEVWEHLDCESVGSAELEQIQQRLFEVFGKGGIQSPASIARTVADEGAVLRHPEVFDCDLNWRRSQLKQRSLSEELDFSNLTSAFESVVKIEQRRLSFQTDGDNEDFETLRKVVTDSRDELSTRVTSRILEAAEREQAKEVFDWLTVWLQSPDVFSDWLDLRRRSPEYQERFGRG